jgi:hypothetical protein
MSHEKTFFILRFCLALDDATVFILWISVGKCTIEKYDSPCKNIYRRDLFLLLPIVDFLGCVYLTNACNSLAMLDFDPPAGSCASSVSYYISLHLRKFSTWFHLARVSKGRR